jgi:hypothetical protein
MEWIILSILGWSATNILVNGSIFDQIRIYLQVKIPFLSKLMTCMQCSGFWVGVLIGALGSFNVVSNPMNSLVLIKGMPGIFLSIFLYGLFVSGISVLSNALVVFFFKKLSLPEINIGEIKKTDEQETI